VIIYLEDEVKDILIAKLHAALKEDGVLFLGGSEKILAPAEVGFELIETCFYRKI
jgi:chemotaxis protein methyltransferase CheR